MGSRFDLRARVPVCDGVAATRTALAALHSARTGEPVNLTTWEGP